MPRRTRHVTLEMVFESIIDPEDEQLIQLILIVVNEMKQRQKEEQDGRVDDKRTP